MKIGCTVIESSGNFESQETDTSGTELDGSNCVSRPDIISNGTNYLSKQELIDFAYQRGAKAERERILKIIEKHNPSIYCDICRNCDFALKEITEGSTNG